jgi:hypothetical protein
MQIGEKAKMAAPVLAAFQPRLRQCVGITSRSQRT